MVHWVLCCVLIATSIRVTSGINCRIDQYKVNQTGKDPWCLDCGDCHPGYGRYPPCGSVLKLPKTSCKPCEDGTYSDTDDSMPCRQCHRCTTTVLKKCSNTSNTVCSSKCGEQDLYYEKASHDCQKCSHCCGDGTDIVIPDCVYQGMAKDMSCTIHNAQRCTPDQTSTRSTISAGGSEGTRSTNSVPFYIWILIALGAMILLALLFLISRHYRKQRQARGATDHGYDRRSQSVVMEEQGSPPAYHQAATNVQNGHRQYGQLPLPAGFENQLYSPSPGGTPAMTPKGGTPINTDDDLDHKGPAKEEKETSVPRESTAAMVPKPEVSRQASVNSTGSQGGNDKEKRGRRPSRTKQLLAKRDSYSLMNEEYSSGTEQNGSGNKQEGAKDPEKRSRSRSRSTLASMEDEEEIVITKHPRPVSILEGEKLVLKCEATGPRDMTYQWLKNGEPVDKQTGATLMVQSTKMRDFGFYACTVGKNKKITRSETAEVDITPRQGTQLNLLTDVSDNARELACLKLDNRKGFGTAGIPNWKDLAEKYSIDKYKIARWEKTDDPANNLMEFLGAKQPNLTVYDFIKTLVAIERNDVVMELVPELTKKA